MGSAALSRHFHCLPPDSLGPVHSLEQNAVSGARSFGQDLPGACSLPGWTQLSAGLSSGPLMGEMPSIFLPCPILAVHQGVGLSSKL